MGLTRLNTFVGALLSLALCLPVGAQNAFPAPNPVTIPTQGTNADFAANNLWQDMGTSALGQQGVYSSWSPSNPGAWYRVAGVLYPLSATASSSTAGAVTSTFILPAYSLQYVGDAVTVRIFGTTAANGNTKAVLFKFGTASITLFSAAANAKDYYADIQIVKTAANAQTINVAGYANAAIFNGLSTTTTQTDTAAIAIAVQLSTATANADTTLTGFTVYAEP
jgi:hypothetical protein